MYARLLLPCGLHHKWVTISEGERMVSAKKWLRKNRKGKTPTYMLPTDPTPSFSRDTPTGITKTELLANIGIGGKLQIERAREKVLGYGMLTWRPTVKTYTRPVHQ